jgi:thiamine pyrophosphate-dependent acetolactate synthase large subunit-like protein
MSEMLKDDGKLARRAVLKRLMRDRGDALVIAGLGTPVWDLAAIDHRPQNFYVWGGMGGAASMGLGLAIAQPDRKVWVISGDGESLMGVGSLATIAARRPANLAVLVFDNEHYGETGMQATHTGQGVDLAGMAASAGFASTMRVTGAGDVEPLAKALAGGGYPLFANIKVSAQKDQIIMPPRDGSYWKHRFRVALLGEEAATHPR